MVREYTEFLFKNPATRDVQVSVRFSLFRRLATWKCYSRSCRSDGWSTRKSNFLHSKA